MIVLNTPVGRVRAVGMVEAVSFLLLVFVAMPMKRIFQMPEGEVAVFWVGLVHGILFLAYAAAAFWAWRQRHLTGKLLLTAAVASVLPFGPFVIDRRLKAVENAQPEPDTAGARG
jgi:integral membrane protein